MNTSYYYEVEINVCIYVQLTLVTTQAAGFILRNLVIVIKKFSVCKKKKDFPQREILLTENIVLSLNSAQKSTILNRYMKKKINN